PRVVGAGGHGGGEAVDPEHAGVGRPGAALAGLERRLDPQAAPLQLGDEVRELVVCAGPAGPADQGGVHRPSAEAYVIRYVRLPSLINLSATSRQPHGYVAATARTSGSGLAQRGLELAGVEVGADLVADAQGARRDVDPGLVQPVHGPAQRLVR